MEYDDSEVLFMLDCMSWLQNTHTRSMTNMYTDTRSMTDMFTDTWSMTVMYTYSVYGRRVHILFCSIAI